MPKVKRPAITEERFVRRAVLARYRTYNDMSVHDFSMKIGVSDPTGSKKLRHPEKLTVAEIARLGMSMDQMLILITGKE